MHRCCYTIGDLFVVVRKHLPLYQRTFDKCWNLRQEVWRTGFTVAKISTKYGNENHRYASIALADHFVSAFAFAWNKNVNYFYFFKHSEWISGYCEFVSVFVHMQLRWSSLHVNVSTSSGMPISFKTNQLFISKKISKIVGSFLVCIETFDRNVSSVRHRFTNSSIFVPFLLFRRNGNGSITSDSRFHVRFALVSISTQTATLYSIDYWIFAYWFPFLWTGTNVLHHGKLFRGKFFFEYN